MFLGACVILYYNCISAANSVKVPKTECSLLGIYDMFETSRMSYTSGNALCVGGFKIPAGPRSSLCVTTFFKKCS
jgi:hypothetical protein